MPCVDDGAKGLGWKCDTREGVSMPQEQAQCWEAEGSEATGSDEGEGSGVSGAVKWYGEGGTRERVLAWLREI